MAPQRPRDLDGWLAWQERINPRGIELGLERLRPVAARMGIDGPGAALITVAGTNGKGSSVAFLEALAIAHGITPGCYQSPHLLRYNESVRVGGHAVSDAVLVDAFARVEAARGDSALTAFEHRTLAALDILRRAAPELVILEVGMGGRLDAVNLLDADVALITAVGLDHREWLGDTLQAVAREKSGIMRAGRPVVCSDPGSAALLAPLAAGAGAHALLAGEHYHFGAHEGDGRWWLESSVGRFDALPPPRLAGAHQRANAAGAVMAWQALGPRVPALDADALRRALAAAWVAGRLQRVPGTADAWVDVAHNPQAAAALAGWLAQGPQAHVLCAMYRDKDLEDTVSAIAPCAAEWHLAGLAPPRGAPVERLAEALAAAAPGARRTLHPDVAAAWTALRPRVRRGGRVVAFGSFETARGVLRLESPGTTLDT